MFGKKPGGTLVGSQAALPLGDAPKVEARSGVKAEPGAGSGSAIQLQVGTPNVRGSNSIELACSPDAAGGEVSFSHCQLGVSYRSKIAGVPTLVFWKIHMLTPLNLYKC